MLKIVLAIVAVLLILISLLQGGKSDGLSAFTGASQTTQLLNSKERGPEKVMSRITLILGILFLVLVIVIRIVEG